MQCPQCQYENLPDSVFCQECGTKLERVCPQCQADNPPTGKFCRKCGAPLLGQPAAPRAQPPSGTEAYQQRSVQQEKAERIGLRPPASVSIGYTPRHLAEKILTSRTALEGERRQVTVLFADLAGFTALAERLDPEVVHEVIDRCFELVTAEVHRFEGTINQYTGDGVMVLFGAPIAHEDGPRRAVHAALGVQPCGTTAGSCRPNGASGCRCALG